MSQIELNKWYLKCGCLYTSIKVFPTTSFDNPTRQDGDSKGMRPFKTQLQINNGDPNDVFVYMGMCIYVYVCIYMQELAMD